MGDQVLLNPLPRRLVHVALASSPVKKMNRARAHSRRVPVVVPLVPRSFSVSVDPEMLSILQTGVPTATPDRSPAAIGEIIERTQSCEDGEETPTRHESSEMPEPTVPRSPGIEEEGTGLHMIVPRFNNGPTPEQIAVLERPPDRSQNPLARNQNFEAFSRYAPRSPRVYHNQEPADAVAVHMGLLQLSPPSSPGL